MYRYLHIFIHTRTYTYVLYITSIWLSQYWYRGRRVFQSEIDSCCVFLCTKWPSLQRDFSPHDSLALCVEEQTWDRLYVHKCDFECVLKHDLRVQTRLIIVSEDVNTSARARRSKQRSKQQTLIRTKAKCYIANRITHRIHVHLPIRPGCNWQLVGYFLFWCSLDYIYHASYSHAHKGRKMLFHCCPNRRNECGDSHHSHGSLHLRWPA